MGKKLIEAHVYADDIANAHIILGMVLIGIGWIWIGIDYLIWGR